MKKIATSGAGSPVQQVSIGHDELSAKGSSIAKNISNPTASEPGSDEGRGKRADSGRVDMPFTVNLDGPSSTGESDGKAAPTQVMVTDHMMIDEGQMLSPLSGPDQKTSGSVLPLPFYSTALTSSLGANSNNNGHNSKDMAKSEAKAEDPFKGEGPTDERRASTSTESGGFNLTISNSFEPQPTGSAHRATPNILVPPLALDKSPFTSRLKQETTHKASKENTEPKGVVMPSMKLSAVVEAHTETDITAFLPTESYIPPGGFLLDEEDALAIERLERDRDEGVPVGSSSPRPGAESEEDEEEGSTSSSSGSGTFKNGRHGRRGRLHSDEIPEGDALLLALGLLDNANVSISLNNAGSQIGNTSSMEWNMMLTKRFGERFDKEAINIASKILFMRRSETDHINFKSSISSGDGSNSNSVKHLNGLLSQEPAQPPISIQFLAANSMGKDPYDTTLDSKVTPINDTPEGSGPPLQGEVLSPRGPRMTLETPVALAQVEQYLTTTVEALETAITISADCLIAISPDVILYLERVKGMEKEEKEKARLEKKRQKPGTSSSSMSPRIEPAIPLKDKPLDEPLDENGGRSSSEFFKDAALQLSSDPNSTSTLADPTIFTDITKERFEAWKTLYKSLPKKTFCKLISVNGQRVTTKVDVKASLSSIPASQSITICYSYNTAAAGGTPIVFSPTGTCLEPFADANPSIPKLLLNPRLLQLHNDVNRIIEESEKLSLVPVLSPRQATKASEVREKELSGTIGTNNSSQLIANALFNYSKDKAATNTDKVDDGKKTEKAAPAAGRDDTISKETSNVLSPRETASSPIANQLPELTALPPVQPAQGNAHLGSSITSAIGMNSSICGHTTILGEPIDVLGAAIDTLAPDRCITIFHPTQPRPPPTELVKEAAKRRGVHITLIDCGISIHKRPRHDQISQTMSQAFTQGDWLVLENATKSISTIKCLLKALKECDRTQSGFAQRTSRIFIIGEQHPHFPAELRGDGHKVFKLTLRSTATGQDASTVLLRPMKSSQLLSNSQALSDLPAGRRRVQIAQTVVNWDAAAASTDTVLMEDNAGSTATIIPGAIVPQEARPERWALAGEQFTCLQWAGDGRIAAGSSGGNVYLYNVKGQPMLTFHAHQSSIWDMDFRGHHEFISGSEDSTLLQWSHDAYFRYPGFHGQALTRFSNDVLAVRYVDPLRSDAIVAGGLNGSLFVIDTNSGQRFIMPTISTILCLERIPELGDGRVLIGGGTGLISQWDIQRRTEVSSYSYHANKVTAIAYQSNSLISAGHDGSVNISDIRFRTPISRLSPCGRSPVTAFAVKGKTLAVAADDQLFIYDLTNTSQVLMHQVNAWSGICKGILIDDSEGYPIAITASTGGVIRFFGCK